MEVLPIISEWFPRSRSTASDNLTTQERNHSRLLEIDAKFEKISHLFDIAVIRRHLIFMKAVSYAARSIHDNFTLEHPSTGIKSPSPAFRVHLTKAAYRYHIWITKCLRARPNQGALEKHEVPPFDVLTILHAHMLAPSRFNEDILLHFPELGLIGRFPFHHIVRLFI
jgi:hypothetical protein